MRGRRVRARRLRSRRLTRSGVTRRLRRRVACKPVRIGRNSRPLGRLRRAIAIGPQGRKGVLHRTGILIGIAEIRIPRLLPRAMMKRSGRLLRLPERRRLWPSRKLGLGMRRMLPMARLSMTEMGLMRLRRTGWTSLCGRRRGMWQRIVVPCHRSEPPSHIPEHPILRRFRSRDVISTSSGRPATRVQAMAPQSSRLISEARNRRLLAAPDAHGTECAKIEPSNQDSNASPLVLRPRALQGLRITRAATTQRAHTGLRLKRDHPAG